MALSKQAAEQRVVALTSPLAEHIAKIGLWPKSQDVPGWTKELRTWLTDVLRIGSSVKTRAGRLSPEFISDWWEVVCKITHEFSIQSEVDAASTEWGQKKTEALNGAQLKAIALFGADINKAIDSVGDSPRTVATELVSRLAQALKILK
jgi:hypothetical protein